MWQRIQTLYFALICAILLTLVFGNAGYIYSVDAPEPVGVRYISKLPYAIFISLSLAANVVALFSWGHRSLQIRLAGASAVLLLALQVWIAVDYFTISREFVFRWTAILPIFAFIFELLAMKGVYADEMLVRSASRLRANKRKKQ
ncbi:MAG: DUF4293 domain-containing protein [Candidatus Cryptobacteroides sp.]